MKVSNHRDRLKKRKHHLQYPQELTLVDPDELPHVPFHSPNRVWVSRVYLVQEYQVNNEDYPGLIRLSINYVKRSGDQWVDGLTWDELMECKRQVGYGDAYAIEVYPKDSDIVNDANMRHLWIIPDGLSIGWFKHADD